MTNSFDSISSYSDAIRAGNAHPSELVGACCSLIKEKDSRLGAFQEVFLDDALKAAEAADRSIDAGHRIGPFHGLPFALKDIVEVENKITTAGSPLRKDHVSTATAIIASRLISSGGILIGKTKTVEFAYGGWGTNEHMGTPWNPWDAAEHRAPGGSSSGSAVAVAAGLAGCAVGTDTGGSVRLPSAWCGLVGLKVTEGLLPTAGIVPLSHTFDTPGPMTRSVRDTALMFETLLGRSPSAIDYDRDQTVGLWGQLVKGVQGVRLAVLDDTERRWADQAMLNLYDKSLDLLSNLGAHIEVVRLPIGFDDLKGASGTIMSAEGYYHHGPWYEDADRLCDSAVRPRILAGKEISSQSYINAMQQRIQDQIAFQASLQSFDALITPTTMTSAVIVETINQSETPAHFTRAANYLGMCGLTLPMGLTDEGLPGGLQVMAPAYCESKVLQIGAAFEEVAPVLGAPSS